MLRGIIGLSHKIEYLAARSRLFYWVTSQYYRNVIKNEINLAGIKNGDHILCIGGGICPFSAILFHQMTGAKVTVIDNCMVCICEARQLINRFGLSDHIHVVCEDGGSIEFSLQEFSVVHMALQVCNLEYVLSKVDEQIIPGTKLLIRRPKKYLDNLYSQLSGYSLSGCQYVTHQKACNIGSTLLYVKQEQLNEGKITANQDFRLAPVTVGTSAADSSSAIPYPVAV